MARTLLTTVVASLLAIAAQAQDVYLQDAWVRALPPVKKVTAAYVTVVNDSDAAVAIVGGSADAAGRVEIHRTREVDGLMRMEPVPGLALAPGERLELAPGGTHLMLFDLRYMPQPGDTVELCLQLSGGAEVCTEADPRKSAGGEHDHH